MLENSESAVMVSFDDGGDQKQALMCRGRVGHEGVALVHVLRRLGRVRGVITGSPAVRMAPEVTAGSAAVAGIIG